MAPVAFPTRQWIARAHLDESEPCSTEHKSNSRLRRVLTVWSDDFDTTFDMPPSLDESTPSNIFESPVNSRSTPSRVSRYLWNGPLHKGPGQPGSLLTDGCFVHGLVDGFDLVLMVAFLLGLIALFVGTVRLIYRLSRPIDSSSVSVGSRQPSAFDVPLEQKAAEKAAH